MPHNHCSKLQQNINRENIQEEICLPALLYASGILGYTKMEIGILQRIENSV